jgi:hypothetical protein
MNIFQTSWEESCWHVLSKSRARSGDKNIRFLEGWGWSFLNHDGMVEKIRPDLAVLESKEKVISGFEEN